MHAVGTAPTQIRPRSRRKFEDSVILSQSHIHSSFSAPDSCANETIPHKRLVAAIGRHLLHIAAHEVLPSQLGRSALVFSPHPDDESLGCGGTILKKKQAGAKVKVVHMTDGSASTPLLPKEQLKTLRKIEALNASRVLEVDETYFLDFPDSQLIENISPAIERVTRLLSKELPDEVFVPYRGEPARQAADHMAATQIVMTALRLHRRTVTVWEYPVWFWLHWPWVRLQGGCQSIKRRHVLRNSVNAFVGARAFMNLTHSVDIRDVLKQKRAALAQHRSQMQKLLSDPRWVTLEQVSSGDFLNCFEQNHEFFRRYDYRGSDAQASSRS
jgi:LmbE family N-acetylglucosaminyl deacetylase